MSAILQFVTLVQPVFVSAVVLALACVFLQVWEGLGVVKTGRQMLGETDPVSNQWLSEWVGFKHACYVPCTGPVKPWNYSW